MSPHTTSPTPSTRAQQGRLLPLARALLLVACTQAPLAGTAWAQSADAVLLTDAFTQAAGWNVHAEGQAARFADGRVTLPALKDGNSAVVALSRELKLAPASAWTASVRITTAANAGADGAAGLTFIGANDTQVAVLLRPQERDVVVIYRDGSTDRWQTPLLGFTASPALRGHGQPNVLNVSSRNGRLYIDVNDQAVGATRSLDFAPNAIGLRNTKTGASYEALKVQAAGQDSRLARLLGIVPTPGARVLFTDAPGSAAGTGRALFSSATGFLKGLTGTSDKASSEPDKPPSPESAWTEDAKDGSYRRDKRRGVVVLTGDDEEAVAWAGPNMLTALPGAPGFVQATVTLLGEAQEDDGPGIYLQPAVHPRDKDQDQSNRDTLFAKINANTLEVLLRDRTTKKWQRLDDVELPNRDPKAPATLRLVVSGTRAIVFLDGRWLTAVDLPSPLAIDRAGVRVEGVTKAEFSGFTVAEL